MATDSKVVPNTLTNGNTIPVYEELKHGVLDNLVNSFDIKDHSTFLSVEFAIMLCNRAVDVSWYSTPDGKTFYAAYYQDFIRDVLRQFSGSITDSDRSIVMKISNEVYDSMCGNRPEYVSGKKSIVKEVLGRT